jgi:tetratricopeptide (TPR) repeat protein
LWWELTRPTAPPAPVSPASHKAIWGPVLFVAGISVGAIVINLFAGIDLNQNGSYIFVELVNRLLYLCALLLGSLVVALRSLEKPQVDERAAPWILYGILVGVGVFLIHNLIEFSLFEPGALCLFGVLMGAALGMRLENRPVRKPGIPTAGIVGFFTACAGFVVIAVWIVVPVIRAEYAAHVGDDKLRIGDFKSASDEYVSAATILPLNADYAFRAGRALHLSVGPPVPLTDPGEIDRAVKLQRDILEWYSLATERDPAFLGAYHFLAIFGLQMDDPERMIANFEKVMDLNPNEVSLRLEYAHGLELLHRLPEAKRQYLLALHYNDLLDKAEPKRLSPEKEMDIRREINALPGNDE